MVSKQSNAQWTGKSCSLRSSGELTATVLGAEMDRVFSSSAIPVCRGEVVSQAASGMLPLEELADKLPLT